MKTATGLPRMSKLFKLLASSMFVRSRPAKVAQCYFKDPTRSFADTPRPDTTTKQIATQGSENEQRVRVRRARPSDAPRILRFVRENSRTAWPNLMTSSRVPPATSQLMVADYVSRALSQGHSMIAEQIGARRGWVALRGLALSTVVCSWDAALLERWAACMKCSHSRRLINFTAHCLRAPALHDKYHVHNYLQVLLILPVDSTNKPEIVQVLAKSVIQRGTDVGFKLMRFDVNNEISAKALEDLKLTKEWHMSYDYVAESIKESGPGTLDYPKNTDNFVSVYTALSAKKNETSGIGKKVPEKGTATLSKNKPV